jgi:hypothetical protein
MGEVDRLDLIGTNRSEIKLVLLVVEDMERKALSSRC